MIPGTGMLWLGRTLGGPRASCPPELHCLEWAFDYLGDCVCNVRQGVSLALGLASVFCWAVAEIPQIVTNFFAGSTEGVSLSFLLTWTVGDVFNLVGCMLEPATLPTQLYMAVMYTITTVILVVQSVYYEFILPHRRKLVRALSEPVPSAEEQALLHQPQPQQGPAGPGGTVPVGISGSVPSAAQPSEIISVPLSRKSSTRDIHISSARSLASSHTPSMGSFIPGSHPHGPFHHPAHLPGQPGHHVGSLLSQSPGQGFPHISLRSPLLPGSSGTPAGPSPTTPFMVPPGLGQASPSPSSASPAVTIAGGSSGRRGGQGSASSTPARAVLSLGLFLLLLGLRSAGESAPLGASSSPSSPAQQQQPWAQRLMAALSTAGARKGPLPRPWHALLGRSRRSLKAQASSQQRPAGALPAWAAVADDDDDSGAGIGEVLGWLMAAIYMGGRLPQIWLNIQRGTVEGLSPLMFLFALLGNVTYVGSILVRSMAWEDLKPNLPWIVDAAVCVLLDTFILGQFVYYSFKDGLNEDEEGEEIYSGNK